MKQVTMNYRVFDNIGPYQYVAPTIQWMAGKDHDGFEIKDLEVTFQLDYKRGEYRVQIIDGASASVMCDFTEQLACARTGDQKNIDDVMGLVAIGLKNSRTCQIQLAINQFSSWFNGKVSEWLKYESERDRYDRYKRPIGDLDLCYTVIIGHETL